MPHLATYWDTHTVELLWSSDRHVTEATTYTTHNKHKRKTYLPPRGIRNRDSTADLRVSPGLWSFTKDMNCLESQTTRDISVSWGYVVKSSNSLFNLFRSFIKLFFVRFIQKLSHMYCVWTNFDVLHQPDYISSLLLTKRRTELQRKIYLTNTMLLTVTQPSYSVQTTLKMLSHSTSPFICLS